MQARISELEGEVTDLVDGMIELAEEKIEVEMELAVANAHLDEHHAELYAIHALEMQLDKEEDPEEVMGASSMDIKDGDASSPTHSVPSKVESCRDLILCCTPRQPKFWIVM